MHKHFLRILVAAATAIFSISSFGNNNDFILPVAKNEIKMMSYNVENLFDANHDQGKNDYEFLPRGSKEKSNCSANKRFEDLCNKTDWTKEKVALKIDQIRKAVEAQGELPDILSLVEVENEAVLRQLAVALGYQGVLITNSPDRRGIDCAILFRKEKLKLVEYIEREVKDAVSPTRNLSAAIFRLSDDMGGDLISYSPNHWPSQGSASIARTTVANAFVNLMKQIRTKYSKEAVHLVASGDFNTLSNERPNAIKDIVLNRKTGVDFNNAHEVAAANKNPYLDRMPPTSYFYYPRNDWNEFDMYFLSDSLVDGSGLEFVSDSFRIHAPDFMTKPNKSGEPTPLRYDHSSSNKNTAGYSDHFAVIVKLKYR